MEPTIINPGSDKHREQLTKLAKFLGLDSIKYEDLGNGERYFLVKGERSLRIAVSGNACDGGFLTVGEETSK